MRIFQLSSGDLVADRRAAYAAALARDHDFAAASDLMEQALELVPGWAAGWCLLGDYRTESGDSGGAIAAYSELARLDREGIFGAALKLAALGAAPAPTGTEIAYVESLFDDYAARFETELVVGLGYAAPERLASLIEAELLAQGLEQIGHALDLGCGTGLMGERLRRRASFLEGIDLSGAMVETAGRKGIYDRLEKAELGAFLAGHAGNLDLVTAADVLNYCGALPPVLAAVRERLAPGGLFAFTLERHEGSEPLILRPSLRYAHGAAAARAACIEASFELVVFEADVLRRDRGAPVTGLLVLARKPRTSLSAGDALELDPLATPLAERH
jgi:predicted TPR repeat methyltransferase